MIFILQILLVFTIILSTLLYLSGQGANIFFQNISATFAAAMIKSRERIPKLGNAFQSMLLIFFAPNSNCHNDFSSFFLVGERNTKQPMLEG